MFKVIAITFVLITTSSYQLEAQIKIKEEKGKYGLVEKRKNITEFIYDEIERCSSNDIYIVQKDSTWGALSLGGEIVIPISYQHLESKYRHLIAQKDEKKGVIDSQNEILLDFKYEDIDHYYKDSIALVKEAGAWFYITDNEKIESEFLVFSEPDKMPLFKECNTCITDEEKEEYSTDKLLEFVFENLMYPKEAAENEVSGMVVISFVVTKSGEIANTIILRDIGSNCGNEGIKVVEKMPVWEKPAENDGEIVNSKFVLPIRFKLK